MKLSPSASGIRPSWLIRTSLELLQAGRNIRYIAVMAALRSAIIMSYFRLNITVPLIMQYTKYDFWVRGSRVGQLHKLPFNRDSGLLQATANNYGAALFTF